MTIRRGSLYAGVFLLAAGGVTLADAAGLLDHDRLGDALGALWPITIVAIGAALIVRRTRAALPAGFVAAAAPGLVLGGMMAIGPTVPVTCDGGPDGDLAGVPVQARDGAFSGTAAVDLVLACGELDVRMQPGDAWRLESRDGTNRTTDVEADPGHLRVTADHAGRRWRLGSGPVDWTIALPSNPRLDVSTEVDAGKAHLDLRGARLGRVDLSVNAGDVRADLATATLDRLEIDTNAGRTVVALPADSFTGDITANAGSVRLCTAAGLGIRVRSTEALGSIRLDGLTRVGDAWETPGYATAPNQADLSLDANVGSVTIAPEGGCQ